VANGNGPPGSINWQRPKLFCGLSPCIRYNAEINSDSRTVVENVKSEVGSYSVKFMKQGKLFPGYIAANLPAAALCLAAVLSFCSIYKGFCGDSRTGVVSADKVALVIGNGSYKENLFFGELPHPHADADDMSNALRKLGYVVIEKQDQTAEQLEKVVGDFAKVAANAQIAIFYFSGHGVQVNNENLLLGINADGTLFKKENVVKLEKYGINLDDPLASLRASQVPVKLFIFDACREIVATKGGPKGLKVESSGAKGSLIAYATAPDSVAFDDPKDHNSIFTKFLLKHLNDPEDLVTIFSQTQDDVAKYTDNAQLPWISFSPGLYGLGISNVPGKVPAEKSKLTGPDALVAKGANPLPLSEPDSPLLEDIAVKKFLQQHFAYLEDQNIDSYLSDYFNPVEWYQQGPTSLDYVRRGLKAAFHHWESISHRIVGPLQITPLSGGGGVLVISAMEFHFMLKSGNQVKGTGKDVIELRAIKDDSGNVVTKIFSQDQLIDGSKE
jgi:Caspase domain